MEITLWMLIQHLLIKCAKKGIYMLLIVISRFMSLRAR